MMDSASEQKMVSVRSRACGLWTPAFRYVCSARNGRKKVKNDRQEIKFKKDSQKTRTERCKEKEEKSQARLKSDWPVIFLRSAAEQLRG
jgi:hypothetical protein